MGTPSLWFCLICSICAFIFLIIVCSCATTLATKDTIDDKIAIYEEENIEIEHMLDGIAKKYIDSDFELAGEDVVKFVMNLSEFNENDVVQENIKPYVSNYFSNKEKIKKLKEDRLNISEYRWNLYFGI